MAGRESVRERQKRRRKEIEEERLLDIREREATLTRRTVTQPTPSPTPTPEPEPPKKEWWEDMDVWLKAQEETQRRAAEDRKRALEEMAGFRTEALGAMEPAQTALGELTAAGEPITEETARGMYGRARVGVEAAGQAQQRQIQERYGGTPSGASLAALRGSQTATTGQLSNIMMDIEIERATSRRKGLLDTIQAARGLGTSLSDIYGRAAQSMADIYGQTIAAVPEAPERQLPMHLGGPTTVGGGGGGGRDFRPSKLWPGKTEWKI